MDKKMITGMAGVYFVAAELSLRKCVVSVTSRSAHGVDILATCGEGEERKTMSIQVKASKNLHHFGLSIDTPRKKPLPLFSTYSSTM